MIDTLYFDGKCPMCRREIAVLRRLKDEDLNLVDLHQLSTQNDSTMPSRSQMLRELHLKTKSNTWLTGLDATVASWQHTPFGWMLVPLRWPIIKPLVDKLYRRWANKRFCKLAY